MDSDKLSNPNYSGPGVWMCLHAVTAENNPNSEEVSLCLIKVIAKSFKCNECKMEFNEFIRTHPFNMYKPIGEIPSIFIWGYEAHKAVRIRQNKTYPTLKEAWLYWSNPEAGVCMHDCTNHAATADNKLQPLSYNNPLGNVVIRNGNKEVLMSSINDNENSKSKSGTSTTSKFFMINR